MMKWLPMLGLALLISAGCGKVGSSDTQADTTEVVAPSKTKRKAAMTRQKSTVRVEKVGEGSVEQCKAAATAKRWNSAVCRPIRVTDTHIECECSHF